MQKINNAVSSFKESIFATMSKLAAEKQAINLSQGFPDFDGPSFALEAIQEVSALTGRIHQYAPFAGVEELRTNLSWLYQEFYQLTYDAQTEITIVNGATEAIFSTLLALLNPGDEVIIFEPFYDSYKSTIELAGAIPIPVTLHAPEFQWKKEELEKAFSSKTKLVILNNPHNPSGRVFSRTELQEIADLVIQNDCYAFSDEVYEFLTFDGLKHIPLASLNGMQARTITASSLGKTFGFTGWKIGWTCTSPELSHAIRMVHQFNTFSVNHPFQLAAAKIIKRLPEYIAHFQKTYQDKRDLFLEGMRQAGFSPLKSQGTYFSLCPIPEGENDLDFCRHLIEKKKVASIPPSAFYMKSNEGSRYLRFCFAKEDQTIRDALRNLSK